MEILLNEEIMEKVNNNNLKAHDIISYILQHSNFKLHFKVKDIKGDLIKENVYSQLSINQLYNDEEKNVKKAYIKDNVIILEF